MGSNVSTTSPSEDGVAAARARCTRPAGQPSRGGADDVSAIGAWAPPVRRPRTTRTVVAADRSETAPPPPRDKLLVAEGRASAASDLQAAMKKNKVAVQFFPGNGFITDELRATLVGLGAMDLECVHRKVMERSDRCRSQNRLLVSCKKMVHGDGEQINLPFDSVLTEAERPLVHRRLEPEKATMAKNKKKKDQQEEKKEKNTDKGLSVKAYDRDGRPYNVQLKYLSSNSSYRVIGSQWSEFLENNGLLVDGGAPQKRRQVSSPDGEGAVVVVPERNSNKRRKRSPADEGPNGEHSPEQDGAAGDDVHIELWAFRSPKVRTTQEGLPPDHHPHGALGLLLLHRRDGEAGIVGAAGVEEARQDTDQSQQQQNYHGGAAAGRDETTDASNGVADNDQSQPLGNLGDGASPPPSRDSPLTPYEENAARGILRILRILRLMRCKQGHK